MSNLSTLMQRNLGCARLAEILQNCVVFGRMFPIVFLVTAQKQSLGQGNVFTGVCLSEGGDLYMMSIPVWLPDSMFLLGEGLCP